MTYRFRAQYIIWLGVMTAIACAGIFLQHKPILQPQSSLKRRVVVLGIDGMDYGITKTLIEEGKLPHLASLARDGSFIQIQTSMPPLSPVAWSSFISGMNPGGHGVFDFVRRDFNAGDGKPLPSDSVTAMNSRSDDEWHIPFTAYVWPTLPKAVLLRRGPTLWRLLEQQGIPCTIYKAPANFPVEETGASVLAGMGTPDVEGTYGMFNYWTERKSDPISNLSGGRAFRVMVQDGAVHLDQSERNSTRPFLTGPVNPFRANIGSTDDRQVRVPFDVWADTDEETCTISLQGHDVVLKAGEWSRWIPVHLELLPRLKSINGNVRFYLSSVSPELRLFSSAINLSSGTDGLASKSFDKNLENELGPFYTKGMPEETKAAGNGILNTGAYLQQSELVLDEGRHALDNILARNKTGFQFIYFSTLDLNCHVMWKFTDTQHPASQPSASAGYGSSVTNLYVEMDTMVGRARSSLRPGDILYVMSDHGFGPLYREFNVSAWLAENGYLVYKAVRSSAPGPPSLDDIDWAKTRAYSLGFQSLYLNRSGRERNGIVAQSDSDPLAIEIRDKLLAFHDPGHGLWHGLPVFHRIYIPSEIYTGDQVSKSPDLILGYSRGYGPSDDSVLGISALAPLADHVLGFSGHHSFDFSLVPGVLFSTKAISSDAARLEDVTATILADFGVPLGSGMTGQRLR